MITSINEWKRVNELVDPDLNSDKSVKLKAYQDDLKYYNTNKNKFDPILTLDEEKQEEAANKLINGNAYLGIAWKMAKLEHGIEKAEEDIRGELTEEEKAEINNTNTENKNKLRELQYDLQKMIKKDLETIKKL